MMYGATSLVFSVNGLLTAPGEKHTSHRSIPVPEGGGREAGGGGVIEGGHVDVHQRRW